MYLACCRRSCGRQCEKSRSFLHAERVDALPGLLRELVDFARKEPLHLKEAPCKDHRRRARKHAQAEQRETGLGPGVPGRSAERLCLIGPYVPGVLQPVHERISTCVRRRLHRGAREHLDGAMHIRVRDTGAGIPEDILPSIFDPFFSTRKETGGSGLGLRSPRRSSNGIGARSRSQADQ